MVCHNTNVIIVTLQTEMHDPLNFSQSFKERHKRQYVTQGIMPMTYWLKMLFSDREAKFKIDINGYM